MVALGMVFFFFMAFPVVGAGVSLKQFDKHLRCPYARVWLEHGAEKASEMLGMEAHREVKSGAPVGRCALANGLAGGAHQDARSPGYDRDCRETAGESSPYMWPLSFFFESEDTVMNWDSDTPTAQVHTRTWYLLGKNWKRRDVFDGKMPGRPGTGSPDSELSTVLHRNELIVFIDWANGTDFKNVSEIVSCFSLRVGGVGAIRPDWFLDSRPYFTDDIASQYLGNQHIYHQGKPTLVKQWRKSDHSGQYFVMSLQEHAGSDGIHWPLEFDIPGEGFGPDLLRSMYNHSLLDDEDVERFMVDQEYVNAGGSCPSLTPPQGDDVWLCSVCAYEYTPEIDGDGAAFEDLPESWVCPRCGSPKAAYNQDKVEDTGDRIQFEVPASELVHRKQPASLGAAPSGVYSGEVETLLGVPVVAHAAFTPTSQMDFTLEFRGNTLNCTALDYTMQSGSVIFDTSQESASCTSLGPDATILLKYFTLVYDADRDEIEVGLDLWGFITVTMTMERADEPEYIPSGLMKDTIIWRDIEYTFSPVWTPPAPTPPHADGYKCEVCFHTYDPETDDSSGVGLAFKDLPSDWVCPICGAAKVGFHRIGGDDLATTPPPDGPGDDHGSVAGPLVAVLCIFGAVGLVLIACSVVAKRRGARSGGGALAASGAGQSLQPLGGDGS